MRSEPALEEDYGDFPRIEEEFKAYLDESLGPRGPDFLYELVAGLDLSPGTSALDLGCGEGRDTFRLAREFGFSVLGIDPVERNIAVGRETLTGDPALKELVRFEPGAAESIPAADSTFDFIWCREVLMFVDLDAAFAECRRVLRSGGLMLIYQVFRTERLEPTEVQLLGPVGKMTAEQMEAAFTGAGFRLEERIDLSGEGGEYGQETTGEPGRRLVHAARLMRDPDRYIARFGHSAYEIMLADCYWHIYRMIGKLGAQVYLLREPG